MASTAKRLVAWAVCAAAFALTVVAASAYTHVPNLFIDPSAIGGFPPWWGSLSLTALLLWSAASSACLVTALILRRTGEGDTEVARFLLATGALAAVAAFDDAFLFHEEIGPNELGVPEKVVLAGWVLLAAAWAFRFRAFLFASDLLLVGLAASCFGGSMAIDLVDTRHSAIEYEDVLKLIGIATFTAYCWREAIAQVTLRLQGGLTSGR